MKSEMELLALLTSEEKNEMLRDGNIEVRFNYMMLSRLQSDCEFYLGFGYRCEDKLWGQNIERHIAYMYLLYNNLLEKPEWLSAAEINTYYERMLDSDEPFNPKLSWD